MSMYGTVGNFRAVTPRDTAEAVPPKVYNYHRARELYHLGQHAKLEKLIVDLMESGEVKQAEDIIDFLD